MWYSVVLVVQCSSVVRRRVVKRVCGLDPDIRHSITPKVPDPLQLWPLYALHRPTQQELDVLITLSVKPWLKLWINLIFAENFLLIKCHVPG